MKQRETIERHWCCSGERRRKKSEKGFFVVFEDNIKIINRRATVTVHICTIVHKCTILHPLMWVFFWSQNV